jgi:hypothetical protein
MSIEEQLLVLEEQFWKGGAQFYEQHLADDCLMVFQEPVGMLARDAAIETISAGPRWKDVAFEDVRIVPLADSAVTLAYRASARRNDDGSQYSAYASSAYVKRNGSWKLAVHQQTPSTGV